MFTQIWLCVDIILSIYNAPNDALSANKIRIPYRQQYYAHKTVLPVLPHMNMHAVKECKVHNNSAALHTKGVRHKQVCTRINLEGQKNCCSPCPTRVSNAGSLDLNSDSLRRSVVQWVRRCAHSWPSELITNVGGWRFDSRPGRWIFSSKYVILISGQAVRGFFPVLWFARAPPSGTFK